MVLERFWRRKRAPERHRQPEAARTIKPAEALDQIDSISKEAPDYRIRAPFEVAVGKTFSRNDLQHWGALKIEVAGGHEAQALVLSTGHPLSASYDWPDEIGGAIKREDTEKRNDMKRALDANIKLRHRSLVDQPYVVHNHPLLFDGEGKSFEAPIPSFGDLLVSGIAGSEIDIILTPSYITFYKMTDEDVPISEDEYRKMNQEEATRYLYSEGILQVTVPLSDPRIEAVLAFMNGQATWSETQEVLKATP